MWQLVCCVSQVHLGSAHGFKQRHNESAVEDEVPVYNVHNADLHKNISFNASPKGVQAAQRQEDGNLDTELERATNNAGLLSEGRWAVCRIVLGGGHAFGELNPLIQWIQWTESILFQSST